MCCGVPVVCIAEGGYRETVVHTQTGYMIWHDYVGSLPMSSEYIENALVHTLSTMPVHTWHDMQGACIRRWNEFSVEVFSQKLQEIVEE
jgi:glycosyltransferase involved in cell wall biosynthesis